MNNTITPQTPWHLWVVGILSLLWNAVGVMSYLMTELGQLESLGMSEVELAYFAEFPAWATAVWALGVWGCLLGSIFLLMRKKWAVWAFGVSIIGLIGTTFFQRVATELPPSMQTPGQNFFAVIIWVITLGLFFYARRMDARGVLR